MALVSMGVKHNSLESYAQRARRLVLPTPTQAVATKQIGILQTGQKRPHPSHIPDHLPAFPDSHAYVQTPVCSFHICHISIFFFNNYCFLRLTNNLLRTTKLFEKRHPVKSEMLREH